MNTLIKALLAAMLIALSFALAACGGGNGGAAEDTTATSAVPFDRAFIDGMVPHHRSAIEMARAAKHAGLTEPELIELADDIIASQQSEIDRMLEWREQWFGSRAIDPQGASSLGLSGSEMGMMGHGAEEIAGADDVDRAFAEAMIPHHEGAIRMAELAQEKADHDEVKQLADDIIEAQQREIGVMEKHAGEGHMSS